MASMFGRETAVTGANATFIAELYARYLKDPAAVDPSWVQFFNEMADDERALIEELRGASWAPRGTRVIGAPGEGGAAAPAAAPDRVRAAQLDSIRALMLIRSHRVRGHLLADLDPLRLEGNKHHPELDPAAYGFTEADMGREVFIDHVLGMESATVGEIVRAVREIYCGHIGVEFMHIQDPDQKAWIQRRIENVRNRSEFTPDERRAILEQLTRAEGFERFLQVKYVGTKRFGIEGGESAIPVLEEILRRGAQLGVEEVVIGMPHRGRLNVLANVMQKRYAAIFSEFQGVPSSPEDVQGSGDVKYHLGTSADREFDGRVVHLSLTANPSHLEAVDPVVVGKVRAKQDQRRDDRRRKVLGILIHGDAAFAGQGLVAETLSLAQIRGYHTGGTIHLVVNNQIGFTTSPKYARSGTYCTDVAKMIQAPILHVNGDDPEAVVHVARIATEFQREFPVDVVIDLVCYRRHGHNEADEPAFTQPLMYRQIARHPTTRQLYAERLVSEGVLDRDQADALFAGFQAVLETELEAAASYKPNKADWFEGKWAGLATSQDDKEAREEETAVAGEILAEVGLAIAREPEGVNVNRKIVRQLQAKREMIETGEGIDWTTAEALAFGTILVEGTPVRLSGQDSGRGTFSQRHSVLVDQETEDRYVPLNNIRQGQARFEVLDSPLSEAGVLGFEYGYSSAEPHALVVWEAQFGDFANGAQVIIDQFIAAAERKWLRLSGLVMLLPHGYEGQGPEHSSARVERYLQLCGENNMRVVNCTTPANYFHALRRQVRSNIRKPLVVMTPKSLLRHRLCVSRLGEMGPGTCFHRTYGEVAGPVAAARVKRVVLCAGKVYYDLLEARRERGIKEVAILRIEQLYPFPWRSLSALLGAYPKAELVWCQEEPANMGAWTFVDRRLEEMFARLGGKAKRARYVGRAEAASTAGGSYKAHLAEQARIVEEALTLG
ncbi:MAG: 2-oxoglutarate dehydrogenase E1 component [Proteobacteria bacterium]|nr:2-oxoglutarate dehydrogenase E1 component [Pseudomonadota bacterium]